MRRFVLGAIVLLGSAARGDAPVAEAAPARPKAVTRAWLRETLQKKGALAQLIDEGSGVVVIEHLTDSPREDFKERVSGVRLCKDELKKRWAKLEEGARYGSSKSDSFVCQNKPGPPLCAFGVMNEYTTITYLLFRATTGGTLLLNGILYLDGLSNVVDKSSITEQEKFVREQLTKLRSTDCNGKGATPPEQYKQFHSLFH